MKSTFHNTSNLHHTMPSSIRAALGPTNTGKTHYALTRMMAHTSGIIGFPLRLLARENYERLVKIKGERFVALITGEEKIVPPSARWFSCTVEAMPLDRKVEFIAIDEIQLAADPDRGHIFTNRLLHARGTVETLFLGAEIIRPLLQKLVPGIEIDIRSRLSNLVNIGPIKLSRLPPRSAIVAFSMTEVYALAEVIRRRRGGCAVIMGQLSPRTRNAQVELYQNREVDYLVATDAIGMGLNMDVDHVALAQLSKFDGTTPRSLFPQEIAQIAGRAGRGMKDGTFGTTADCPAMSTSTIDAIEQHRFDPIQRIYWRNHDLDFSSPNALLSSLTVSPPSYGLTAGRVASDVITLENLSLDPEIQAVAKGRRATALLWEVCQIPDFRKIGDDSHTRLCGRLFLHIAKEGSIPANWFEGHIRAFTRTDGDIDTLMHRLTGVRVCSYVAARTEWSRHSTVWQQRAREVEDLLSDALHEQLTARFVDRRATSLLRRLDNENDRNLLSAVTAEGEVIVEGHTIGKIEGFTLKADITNSPDKDLILRAGRRALLQEIPRRVRALQSAPDQELAIDLTSGTICWNEAPLGKLIAGDSFFHPKVKLFAGEFSDVNQRNLVEQRLYQFIENFLKQELKLLFHAKTTTNQSPIIRGIIHRLYEDGGITTTLKSDYSISLHDKKYLHKFGIEVGSFFIFFPKLLRPQPLKTLTLLTQLFHKKNLTYAPAERVSMPWDKVKDLPGWLRANEYGIRIDIAEKCIAELSRLTKKHSCLAPPNLTSKLGIKSSALPAALSDLGIAYHQGTSLNKKYFGPAAPLTLLSQKHAFRTTRTLSKSLHRKRPAHKKINADSPFAALEALQKQISS